MVRKIGFTVRILARAELDPSTETAMNRPEYCDSPMRQQPDTAVENGTPVPAELQQQKRSNGSNMSTVDDVLKETHELHFGYTINRRRMSVAADAAEAP